MGSDVQTNESKKYPTISVYIITKNEEKNIRAALASVSWADEIIIVDSGSTDSTVEIAKKAGAIVFDEPFCGFVEQKNSAMNHCSCDWVLNLDADEEITPELEKSIREAVKNQGASSDISIYTVPRKTWYMGRWILHCGWYPEYRARLSKKGKARWEGEMIHEKLEGDGAVGKLSGDLLHRPYKDLGEHMRKMNLYTELWAKSEKARGRRISWCSILFRPPATFIKMYFLRGGFLDFGPGLIVSIMGAGYTFMKYARLIEYRKISN